SPRSTSSTRSSTTCSPGTGSSSSGERRIPTHVHQQERAPIVGPGASAPVRSPRHRRSGVTRRRRQGRRPDSRAVAAMQQTLLHRRSVSTLVIAAAVGTWGLHAFPVRVGNPFLVLIAARRPHVFQFLAYGYATLWFTTPYLLASARLHQQWLLRVVASVVPGLVRRPDAAVAWVGRQNRQSGLVIPTAVRDMGVSPLLVPEDRRRLCRSLSRAAEVQTMM